MEDTTQIYESNNLRNISRSCSRVAQSQSNILIGIQVKEFLDMASDHTAVKDFVLARGSSVSCVDILLLLAIFVLWVLIRPSGLERVQQTKAKA